MSETNGEHVIDIEDLPERQTDLSIKIGGKDYLIVEMQEADLNHWQRFVGTRVQVDRRGKPVKQDYRGMHAELIHQCLRTPDGQRVPRETIQTWGTYAKNRLFALCRSHNGMTDDVETVEKNS